MKKTLLLLPLVIVALTGCTEKEESTKPRQWITLEQGQVLDVYCDTKQYTFSSVDYKEIKFYTDFKYRSYEGIKMIKVETTKTSYVTNYEFVGSNINYCLATVTYL